MGDMISFGWDLGHYLRLRCIQHQIIEFAEYALLQPVPGYAPVLIHEKRRSKPEKKWEKMYEESTLKDLNKGTEILSQPTFQVV